MDNLNSLIVQRWQKWFQLLSQNNSLNLELLLMLCSLTIPGTSPSHPGKCSFSHQIEIQVLREKVTRHLSSTLMEIVVNLTNNFNVQYLIKPVPSVKCMVFLKYVLQGKKMFQPCSRNYNQ